MSDDPEAPNGYQASPNGIGFVKDDAEYVAQQIGSGAPRELARRCLAQSRGSPGHDRRYSFDVHSRPLRLSRGSCSSAGSGPMLWKSAITKRGGCLARPTRKVMHRSHILGLMPSNHLESGGKSLTFASPRGSSGAAHRMGSIHILGAKGQA